MKKLFVSLFLITCALISFAQNESEHLTFKGVPIDGTLREYVEKMKNAGFEYVGEDEGTAVLKGDFAGYKECYIYVSTLESINLVNNILVVFPKSDKWPILEHYYANLKSMLTEKYGKPSSEIEKFKRSYITDDFYISELRSNRCTWQSVYSLQNGNILLKIIGDYDSGCKVILKYSDKKNTESIRSHAINDL